MGIKSTVTITREEAERQAFEKIAQLLSRIRQMSDPALERLLEEFDEQDDNPFTNYAIEG